MTDNEDIEKHWNSRKFVTWAELDHANVGKGCLFVSRLPGPKVITPKLYLLWLQVEE